MSADTIDDHKARSDAEIEAHRDELLSLSHDIWSHPELCYAEAHAHDVLTGALDRHGFRVERGAFGLETAFAAELEAPRANGPRVALICEYDALPGLGHACGHNIIASSGLGAALGAAAVASALDGRLVVFGTPAEEGGGGKALMIREGMLDGVDVAMMVHPADADLDAFWAIAIHELHVEYSGIAAHAAAAPHKGRNALDAAVLGYMAVAALRQHIAPHERIHGVFTDGGDKPNIVPHHSAMQWYVRSGTRSTLAELEPRVLAALRSGAIATGCEMSHRWIDPAYDDLVTNQHLDGLYAKNAARVGRTVRSRDAAPEFLGSTDMGNVSQVVPSIHPMIAAAPSGTSIHTEAFAAAAVSDLGDLAVIDGARTLAATAIDLWARPELVAEAKTELRRRLGHDS